MFYGSIEGFKSYHQNRGRDTSAFTDDDISVGLLVGSEWIDPKYRNRFPGYKLRDRDQVREWPRYDAFDIYDQLIGQGTIPVEVENATYEAALRHMQSPGSLSIDWTPNEYKSASVSGAVSVQYMQYNSADDVQTRFKLIEEILSSLIGTHHTKKSISSLSGSANRI